MLVVCEYASFFRFAYSGGCGCVMRTVDVYGVRCSRYLVRGDECGFSVQHEILKKGTPVRLEFRNHVYAVMITSGHGKVALLDHQGNVSENNVHKVSTGSFFALNASESIELEAESDELHAVR